MSFQIINCQQRSPEWFAARLGRLTGSGANAMLSKGKGSDEAAGRRNLRTRLVLERLTGTSQEDDFTTRDIQHGIDTEFDAVGAYEAHSGQIVERVGFLQHPTLMTGCSPDGVIGDFEGLVSIKCPKSATHLDALETRTVPTDYLRQITHELWITGAQWCDYFSFDNRFAPESLQALRIRVEASTLKLDAYEKELLTFLREVDDKLASVLALAKKAEAA